MTALARRYLSLLLISLLLFGVTIPACAGPGSGAFFQSLLIPGWGQYSLGDKRGALVFFGSEVLMLGGLLTLQAYGESTRDDYKAFTAAHAGVTGEHDHDFYVDAGNWTSVYDFNNQRMLDRSYGNLYTEDSDYWLWDTDQNRAQMERIRIRSDRAFNSIIYIGAGMAINHIVSAIHAGHKASVAAREDLSEAQQRGLDVSWSPLVTGRALGVKLKCRF